jgi:cytochrome P450
LSALASEHLTPGPRGVALLRTLLAYSRDPFRTLLHLAGEYGDVVRFVAGPVNAFLVNGAQHVETVLVRDAWLYAPVRPFTVERAMRQGLFTSDGYVHHHQRQLLQQAYAHEHVAPFGRTIVWWSNWLATQWRGGVEVDLEAQFERLLVYISAEILFGESVRSNW